MRHPSTTHRRLASAHLALADDPEPPASQRSLPRAVGALAAAVALALATPLAWAAASPGKLPADRPSATASGSKAAGAELAAADDDGGDGPPLGDDDHGLWLATIA
jgi:hypothetical protein